MQCCIWVRMYYEVCFFFIFDKLTNSIFFDKLTNFSCHPTFWSQLSSRQSCVWETMQNGVRHSSSVLEQRENDEGGIAKIFAADLSKVHLLLCQVSSPKNYGPPSDHWGALFKQKMSDLRRMLHDPKPLQLICFHFVLFFWFWNTSKERGWGLRLGWFIWQRLGVINFNNESFHPFEQLVSRLDWDQVGNNWQMMGSGSWQIERPRRVSILFTIASSPCPSLYSVLELHLV